MKLSSVDTYSRPGLSIIIPTYQAEGHIRQFVEKLSKFSGYDKVEIICVDDASKDNTWLELSRIKTKNAVIKTYRLTRNIGQHRALLYGISKAQSDHILTLDDDMFNRLDQISDFIKSATAMKKELVYARFKRNYADDWRAVGSNLLTLLLRTFSSLVEGASQIRLIDRKLQSLLGKQQFDSYVFIDCLLPQLTTDIGFVNLESFSKSPSRYSFTRLLSMTFQIVLHCTYLSYIIPVLIGGILISLGIWFSFLPLLFGLLAIVFSRVIVNNFRQYSIRKLNRLAVAD